MTKTAPFLRPIRAAMTLPSPVSYRRNGSLFPLAALALAVAGPATAPGKPFPTPEQLQALEASAIKAHPMPPELEAQLTGKLADMIVAKVTPPLQTIRLPAGFQLDDNAFRRAFFEDWNRNDDVEERSRHAEEAFAPARRQLAMLQRDIENRLARAHAALPGVTVLENGIHIETRTAAAPCDNVSVLKADSFEIRDLKGNLFFASPFGEGNLVDMADLPEAVAELLDRLPSAQAWFLVLPTSLLTGETPREGPGRLVLILQHVTEGNCPSAWERFSRRLAPALANLPENVGDASFRTELSTYAGHRTALQFKHLLRTLPLENGIHAQQLCDALLERFNRAVNTPLNLEENRKTFDAAQASLQTFRNILNARRTEIERGLMHLHAEKPGVRTMPSGLQYSVEQAATAADNRPFSRANRVRISRIGGKTLVEQRMRPGELDCIAEIADEIPDGKTWTFYVPGNLIGDYRLLDNMEAGVVLTYGVSDDDEDEEWPRAEQTDETDATQTPPPGGRNETDNGA